MAGSITPGPWTWERPSPSCATIWAGDACIFDAIDCGGNDANLRAIAEVPAMLAIVQQLHSGDTTGAAIDAVLAECRAILGRIDGDAVTPPPRAESDLAEAVKLLRAIHFDAKRHPMGNKLGAGSLCDLRHYLARMGELPDGE